MRTALSARAADLAQNATAFGYTATWWEMSTGRATVSELKPCGSRKPFSFCDPHLRQRLWAYVEEVDAALTTRSHRRLAEAVVHGRRMPARFAKGHAPIPLQISGQEDSATPTARATYEFVEAAARGQDLKLTPFNIQRLLLVLMMLASKYLDDYFVSNKQWAMIGDLQTRELNHIEVFLQVPHRLRA